MKVFIYDDKTGGIIQNICEDLGVLTMTQEMVARESQKGHTPVGFIFDEVDALIIEMTKPTQDIQFILAQATLLKKPTLCLYAKNQSPRELLGFIKRHYRPASIKTFSYVKKELEERVEHFLTVHDPESQHARHISNIRFTMRLSEYVDDYVTWYAKEYNMTKAKAMRNIMHNAIEDDMYYLEKHQEDLEKKSKRKK